MNDEYIDFIKANKDKINIDGLDKHVAFKISKPLSELSLIIINLKEINKDFAYHILDTTLASSIIGCTDTFDEALMIINRVKKHIIICEKDFNKNAK